MKGTSLLPLSLFLLLLLILTPIESALADFDCERVRIENLIEAVAESGLIFHRNGDTHDSKAAASHLRLKFENALNSWFAPPKESWTAEKFVEELASKSSWSGKPYLIEKPGEEPRPIRPWLMERLRGKGCGE